MVFRRSAYTRHSQEELLVDVMSLANARIEGPRYIILGAETGRGEKAGDYAPTLFNLPREIVDSTHRYHAVIRDYIEPPLNLTAESFAVNGKQLVALILEGCEDRPYMVRADHSASLRRGDAWIRVNNENQRMGRRQLESIFARRFAGPLFSGKLTIGFDNDMLTQEQTIRTQDPAGLPSRDARKKLQTLIEAKEQAAASPDENTFITRLTHARLFGSDQPYKAHSVNELRDELNQLEDRYKDRDHWFLFGMNGQELNLAIINESEQPIEGAAVALMLPRNERFLLALDTPRNPATEQGGRRSRTYPTVGELTNAYQVTESIGTLGPRASITAFQEPLRLWVDKRLAGKTVTMHYKIFGRNLRKPITGSLTLKLV